MNRVAAIVITSITSFVVFMMSFLLLVKFCNLMKLGGAARSPACVAKVTTDTTVHKLGVGKLSSSALPS